MTILTTEKGDSSALSGLGHSAPSIDTSLNFLEKAVRPANPLITLSVPSEGDFSVYVDYVRKRYSIPVDLAVFVTDSAEFTSRVRSLIYFPLDFTILGIDDKKLKGRYSCGVSKGAYYYLVSVQTVNGLVHVLFCNDLGKFEKEFFGLPVDIKRGVFVIQRSGSGSYLSPLPLSNMTLPILNNDLLKGLNEEIRSFVDKEEVYKEHNLEYKRGILLYGLPGNGKTTLVKYFLSTLHKTHKEGIIGIIANSKDDSDLQFVKSMLSSSELKNELKVVVLEDIDGVEYHTRSQLLNLLDGVGMVYKTIFIATTNFPDKLDMALRNRPSRFDSYYEIDVPNQKSRSHFLTFHFPILKGKELTDAVNLTENFPGSYFKELFILTKLHDISVKEAIIKLTRKMKLFEEFQKNNGTTYIG